MSGEADISRACPVADMVRDSRSSTDEPALQPVLDALDDPVCRRIVSELDEPMTAHEIADTCEVPPATTYRKLGLLSDAALLDETVNVRADGHHTTRYRVDFDRVALSLTEDRELEVSVERPEVGPEDRLATLWTEVQQQL